ncbi:hypothetical protein SCB71_21355 (plasmid) [Herbiconiux sp. KACC 21604]|uniref:hypothetical protein n=1 Tax=unclassified Herbiconiux TaxID=2618217 RepID=UPI00149301B2|nr:MULTISPECIES: hypothetical protein [unclassified Herbiconiux]QJU56292.1 hypothetical protein HL652_21155 [Herbiconiux sp. SALV-R1]WPO88797.1 hypothetical protein SCB71_21355 [Herbiconiux sp. KACC 21604]
MVVEKPECTNPFECASDGIGDAINGGRDVFGFFSDPWGKTFEAMRDASKSLANDLLPALTSATLPDLTVDWFISAYAISFATAILVMIVILLAQLVRTARGHQSGRALAGSLGLYTPLFLGGAMFGPLIGWMLVGFFHSLSNVFMSWGITGSVDDTINGFQTMLDEADPTGMAGGVPVAAILMVLMLIGLLLVLCILIVQLVALYFMGVIVPLGIVWIIDENHRRFGLRVVGLWVGILASHPLLFLLLGVAFQMMGSSVNTFGNNASLKSLVNLVVAVIALFIAAFSPLLLKSFAPVIPLGTGGSNGAGKNPGSWGSDSLSTVTEKQHPEVIQQAAPTSSSQATPAAAEAPAVVGAGSGGLSAAAAERVGGFTGAVAGPATGASSAGTSAASSGVGTAAGGAAAGVSGAAAGVAGAGEGIAAGTAAVGSGESATGAGAVIGVPTLIAAGAIAAGAKVGEKAVEFTDAAAQQSLDTMDDEGEGL